MNIVVIGSANMDMSIQIDRIPEIGETITGKGFMLSSGGKGANQAVACAKMNMDTTLVAKVGDDVFGRSILDTLRGYGVRTEDVGVETGVTTGVAAITVCRGNNSIILEGGANVCVTPSYIEQRRELLLGASAIVLQLEIPLESVYAAIKIVKGQVPIFLNPAPAVPLDEAVLRGVDYFLPNEIECRLYTGVEITTVGDAFVALNRLREIGIRYPLITLGENGIAYYNGNGNVHQAGYKVDAVDTTAAGDTFAGVFATMVVTGKTIDESVELAQRAASISVTRHGAQQAIPYLSQIS